MRILVAGVLICAVFAGPAWSQAFNCNFAKQPDELAICRDDSLKALDEQMADRFFKIRQQLPETGMKQINGSQKDFLKRRNFCGTDGDCIASAYTEHMDALCALASDYGIVCE